jgi:hypothetical protein
MFRPGGSSTGRSGTEYKGKKFSANFERDLFLHHHHHHHHHHKHQGLDSLIHSISRVTTALSPTFPQSSNSSPSLWSVVTGFQRDSV